MEAGSGMVKPPFIQGEFGKVRTIGVHVGEPIEDGESGINRAHAIGTEIIEKARIVRIIKSGHTVAIPFAQVTRCILPLGGSQKRPDGPGCKRVEAWCDYL